MQKSIQNFYENSRKVMFGKVSALMCQSQAQSFYLLKNKQRKCRGFFHRMFWKKVRKNKKSCANQSFGTEGLNLVFLRFAVFIFQKLRTISLCNYKKNAFDEKIETNKRNKNTKTTSKSFFEISCLTNFILKT